MKLGSFIWPKRPSVADDHYEEAAKQAKAELSEAVQTLTRRSSTVTRIAQDAISTMHHEKGGGN
jgi:hypothetical protein